MFVAESPASGTLRFLSQISLATPPGLLQQQVKGDANHCA